MWSLPDPANAPGASGELIGVGADLEPGTALAAYRQGLFLLPLPVEVRAELPGLETIGWWSPDPRGVLPLDELRVTKSLRRSCKRYEVRIDTAFSDVLRACADPRRPYGWIDDDVLHMYERLFDLGWAHSVETYDRRDGTLAGGLIGVGTGAYFSGDSMFHVRTDASKVALIVLVEQLRSRGCQLLDVQWCTEHLASLGAVEIPRAEYLERLAGAVATDSEPLGPLEQPRRFE